MKDDEKQESTNRNSEKVASPKVNYFNCEKKKYGKKSKEEIEAEAYQIQSPLFDYIEPEFRWALSDKVLEERELLTEDDEKKMLPYFIPIPLSILFMPKNLLSDLGKLVFAFLYGMTIFRKGHVFPTCEYIGTFLNRSKWRIGNAIKNLKDLGLVDTIERETYGGTPYYLVADLDEIFLPIGPELTLPSVAKWEDWNKISHDLTSYYNLSRKILDDKKVKSKTAHDVGVETLSKEERNCSQQESEIEKQNCKVKKHTYKEHTLLTTIDGKQPIGEQKDGLLNSSATQSNSALQSSGISINLKKLPKEEKDFEANTEHNKKGTSEMHIIAIQNITGEVFNCSKNSSLNKEMGIPF